MAVKKQAPKKQQKKSRRENRRELKKRATEHKGGACESCGYDRCLSALTFHHRHPNKKDFNVSEMIDKIEWFRIEEEINNCSLLCANCHYEVHEGLLDGYID